ncbi:apoptosis regulatory protein Siva-like [Ptychodera flava]|uniref:apoptosis regulatory protein Siva-like n=1 Tax=Ptychodera flava TaxID=63121 RepID=UPI003969C508
MPKRRRSQDFGSPLQTKTHVGVKQMNESKESSMKDVYDKTHSLLFSASSLSCTSANIQSSHHRLCTDSSNSNFQIPNGQCMLNAQGQIIPATKNSHQGHDVNELPVGNCCTQCRQVCYASSVCPCQYCDKLICRQCQQDCDDCSGKYCLFCIITNYEDRYERHLCVNCSS